ncbi:MAG: phage tail protein, partial [Acidiphilium sp. 21-62-4]
MLESRYAANTTALIVPDLYVQIVPPQSLLLNGVPTDVLGVVGSASWGPVNEPMIVGSMGDYATAFGPVMARQYDIGTVVAIGVQQGASNFRCVRVTDGTDTAASVSILGALTLTALYTGSLGSALVATVSVGSAANSWRVTVALPGQTPEVFDNIIGSGAAFWQAVASAINIGTGPMRGASRLVVASAGTSSLAPSVGAFPFLAGSPGTDGATGMTSGMVIGQDVVPRSGMYALRGQGCSIIVLADLDDPTQWSTEVAFGL